MGCDKDMVVSPNNANQLMDWVQDGTISIKWVRLEKGPAAKDESMDTYCTEAELMGIILRGNRGF